MALGRYLRQARTTKPYETVELWQRRGKGREARIDRLGQARRNPRVGRRLRRPRHRQPRRDRGNRSKGRPDAAGRHGAGNPRHRPRGREAYVSWVRTGVPDAPIAAADHGVEVRRRYLDRAGNPLSADSVRSGEVVRVELTLSSPGPLDNVVLEDLLPAGLEIETPGS